MAKRKNKNFKIEQEELAPITLGHFESRRRSNFGIFIILTLFVGIIVFLPQISNYVNAYLDSRNNPSNPGYRPNSPIEIPSDITDPDKTYYTYSTSLVIQDDNISLSNFNLNLEAKTLSFNVNNLSKTDLINLNYYVELYTSDHTLLERIKLAGKENLNAGGSLDMVKNLSDNSINMVDIAISKLDVNEYPNIVLTPNTAGITTLVCENKHEKVTYSFTDNKLKTIASEVNYTNIDFNYQDIYQQYRALQNSYNVLNGVSSTFFESQNGFNILTNVNLENASRTYIFNADTFLLDTEARVVSFEMESQGFECS